MKNPIKKYLIIGGAGFIGCNFAELLLTRGDTVTVFDNFSRRGSEVNAEFLRANFPQVTIVKGDIRFDTALLASLVEEHDVVYHLAAQVAVTTSVVNPREDFDINALGTFNILEAVRNSKRRPTLLYASTNKVYGGMEDVAIIEKNGRYEYQNLPGGVSEARALDFHSPYGCSKGAGDQYVRDYARIYGMKTVVLRQSCIYGPHQFGIEDQGWVAWFIIAAVLGKPLTIYGDGKQIRDVLYIKDLFNIWDLAEEKSQASIGEVYNIGGGPANTLSLLELIAFIEKKMNKKIPLSYGDWRPGDQQVYVSDIGKAERQLGWRPIVAPLAGVELLYAWIEDHKQLFS